MRANVTIEGIGLWDVKNQLWQITASAQVMVDLCSTFEHLGAVVDKPDTLARHRSDYDDRGSAEYWETQFRAMEEAARWQHERIRQLEEDRDYLTKKLKAASTQSTATNGWAEILFAAVGPALSESVFKALTKCLHPDVSGADRTLQQQLNAARDKARRT